MSLIIGVLLITPALGLFTDCTGVVKSGWGMTFLSIFDTSGILIDSSDILSNSLINGRGPSSLHSCSSLSHLPLLQNFITF